MRKLLGLCLFLIINNTQAQCTASINPSYAAITCGNPASSFTVFATTPAPSVRHDWYSPYAPSVPFYTSTNTSSSYSNLALGIYTVVTTYTSIACSTTSTFEISSIAGFPTFSVSSNSGYSVGCFTSSSLCITNTVSSSNAPVQYLFVAPGSTVSPPYPGFSFSSIACKVIAAAGTWTVVVLDPFNSCQTVAPVLINQYASPNVSVSASFPTQTLSCNNQSIVATGNSGSPGAQISWQIPSNNSIVNSPTVNIGTSTGPGFSSSTTAYADYTVIATSTVNGCQSHSVIPFYQNFIGAGASSFSYTLGAGGSVNFSNTTGGTNPSCIWDFGDGNITIGNSVSHTYVLSGTYPVKLDVYDSGSACFKTSTVSINVTSAQCAANTNFSVVSTGTPQYWNIIPDYPWNFSNAIWSWGDGSSSNALFPSHTYSASGVYTVCLTATVSCGTSSSTCSSHYLYKATSNAAMININVIQPNSVATSITNSPDDSPLAFIYPNPCNDEFTLKIKALKEQNYRIDIYNVIGEEVYFSTTEVINGEINKTVNVRNFNNGVYVLEVRSENNTFLRKIVVNK